MLMWTTIARECANEECLEAWYIASAVVYPGMNFFWGWVQQIQLKTEGRQNGDLRAVAP
jgi:hypothetical protein